MTDLDEISVFASCRLCDSQETTKLYTSKRYFFNVAKCQDCGLVSVQNPPSENTLREMYSEENSFIQFSNAMKNNKVHLRHERFLLEIKAFLDGKLTSQIQLFDIGAGSGDFLNEARNAGFFVFGNEFSTAAVRYAWAQYEIILDTHPLEEDWRDSYFDVITMWGLLEHVRDPLDVLTQAARLLKPGGVMYIYTPVWCFYDTFGLLLAKFTNVSRLLDRRISNAHLQLFPKTTLEWAINQVGLQVLKFDQVCEYNLPVVAYLESLGVPDWLINFLAWVLDLLIERNLFFRNNSRIFCRKN